MSGFDAGGRAVGAPESRLSARGTGAAAGAPSAARTVAANTRGGGGSGGGAGATATTGTGGGAGAAAMTAGGAGATGTAAASMVVANMGAGGAAGASGGDSATSDGSGGGAAAARARTAGARAKIGTGSGGRDAVRSAIAMSSCRRRSRVLAISSPETRSLGRSREGRAVAPPRTKNTTVATPSRIVSASFHARRNSASRDGGAPAARMWPASSHCRCTRSSNRTQPPPSSVTASTKRAAFGAATISPAPPGDEPQVMTPVASSHGVSHPSSRSGNGNQRDSPPAGGVDLV
jgi:hypothetical protein